MKFTDYPSVQELVKNNIFLLDGPEGTKQITADDMSKSFQEMSGTTNLLSDIFLKEKEYAEGDYCIHNNTLYKFITSKEPGEWDPSVVEATNVGNEFAETNRDINDIIIGGFNNKKSGDTITISKPVRKQSFVFILPIYSSVADMKCNFACATMAAGTNSFLLTAYDTGTQAASLSTALAGRYIIVPSHW